MKYVDFCFSNKNKSVLSDHAKFQSIIHIIFVIKIGKKRMICEHINEWKATKCKRREKKTQTRWMAYGSIQKQWVSHWLYWFKLMDVAVRAQLKPWITKAILVLHTGHARRIGSISGSPTWYMLISYTSYIWMCACRWKRAERESNISFMPSSNS